MSRERQRNSVSICRRAIPLAGRFRPDICIDAENRELTAEKPESCIEAANRMDQHIADGTVSGFNEFYEFN